MEQSGAVVQADAIRSIFPLQPVQSTQHRRRVDDIGFAGLAAAVATLAAAGCVAGAQFAVSAALANQMGTLHLARDSSPQSERRRVADQRSDNDQKPFNTQEPQC